MMVSEWASEGQSSPAMRSERARPMQSSRSRPKRPHAASLRKEIFPCGIGDDDAFVDGVEDGLEEALLAGEPQQVILDFLRPDAPDALDEFFEEAGGHGADADSNQKLRDTAIAYA